MKKTILLFCFIFSVGCTFAQSYTPAATIPPYSILTTDSVRVTSANLKKNKPVMIIYFAPDCSHCKNLMQELKPQMEAFKNIQVVMITFVLQLKPIQTFYHDFDLKNYPNFTVGTEGYTYLVQRYYRVTTTPYVALYDKHGRMTKFFDKEPKADDIVAAAKKL